MGRAIGKGDVDLIHNTTSEQSTIEMGENIFNYADTVMTTPPTGSQIEAESGLRVERNRLCAI